MRDEIMNRRVVDIRLINDSFSPEIATSGSSGYDLKSVNEMLNIRAGETVKISTGVSLNIQDENIGAFVYPRSSLFLKKGLILVNSVGVIDSDYQGVIQLVLYNLGSVNTFIEKGERVAQLVFQPIIKPVLNRVDKFLGSTDRGTGGFGSTGD